jgi:hypothetical protein
MYELGLAFPILIHLFTLPCEYLTRSYKSSELSLSKFMSHFLTWIAAYEGMINLMFLDLSLSFCFSGLSFQSFTHYSLRSKSIHSNRARRIFSDVSYAPPPRRIYVLPQVWLILCDVPPPGGLWVDEAHSHHWCSSSFLDYLFDTFPMWNIRIQWQILKILI